MKTGRADHDGARKSVVAGGTDHTALLHRDLARKERYGTATEAVRQRATAPAQRTVARGPTSTTAGPLFAALFTRVFIVTRGAEAAAPIGAR